MRQYYWRSYNWGTFLTPLSLFIQALPIDFAVSSGNGNRLFTGNCTLQLSQCQTKALFLNSLIFRYYLPLKILFSMMDLIMVGSFDRSLKSEARRFSEKSVCPPSCSSPLKFWVPPFFYWLLGNKLPMWGWYSTIDKSRTRSVVCCVANPLHLGVDSDPDPNLRIHASD